ncbi:DUF6296 family protein [Streptomyces sp. FH025]|uniref:DUF6296 family protein n=1 Tax=Streptomyces sp. FH025 TaxID=2815937 RepID=UPI0035B2A892
MNTASRYAVTLPGVPGGHAPPEVIIVHASGETTRDGRPVFADSAGTLRVEITGEAARPLATPRAPAGIPACTPSPCPDHRRTRKRAGPSRAAACQGSRPEDPGQHPPGGLDGPGPAGSGAAVPAWPGARWVPAEPGYSYAYPRNPADQEET